MTATQGPVPFSQPAQNMHQTPVSVQKPKLSIQDQFVQKVFDFVSGLLSVGFTDTDPAPNRKFVFRYYDQGNRYQEKYIDCERVLSQIDSSKLEIELKKIAAQPNKSECFNFLLTNASLKLDLCQTTPIKAIEGVNETSKSKLVQVAVVSIINIISGIKDGALFAKEGYWKK